MAIPNTALGRATEDVVVPGDAMGNFGVDARGEEEGSDILDCQGAVAMRMMRPTILSDC